jgi:hypothetical protein
VGWWASYRGRRFVSMTLATTQKVWTVPPTPQETGALVRWLQGDAFDARVADTEVLVGTLAISIPEPDTYVVFIPESRQTRTFDGYKGLLEFLRSS